MPTGISGVKLGFITAMLLDERQVSKGYEHHLRHRIRAKLATLTVLELPLLEKSGFCVSANSNALVAQPDRIKEA